MFNVSPVQIVIVLLIVLVIFGPKRLPEIGRGLGRSLRDFKGELSDVKDAASQATAAVDLTHNAPTA